MDDNDSDKQKARQFVRSQLNEARLERLTAEEGMKLLEPHP